MNSQRRQDSVAQCNAALVPLQCLSARAAKERKKKQQSKRVFSFPPEERCPSLSQGKMMVRALLQREGAFSAPQREWDGTTHQSKRNGTIGTKERKKETTIRKCIFFSF